MKWFAVGLLSAALLIGFIVGYASKRNVNDSLMLFLKTGLCGGFTTFSTFALESARLFQDGRCAMAVIYIFFSTVLSVLAVLAAEALVK